MNMRTAALTFLLLTFFGHSSASDNRPRPQLEFSAKYSNEKYSLRIKNISSKLLRLGPVNFSNSLESGYWLFIYNLEDRKIEQAWATTNPIFGGSESSYPDKAVPPSGQIDVIFSKNEITSYFSSEPKCYYVIFLYRKKIANSLVFSSPTTPILHCKK